MNLAFLVKVTIEQAEQKRGGRFGSGCDTIALLRCYGGVYYRASFYLLNSPKASLNFRRSMKVSSTPYGRLSLDTPKEIII